MRVKEGKAVAGDQSRPSVADSKFGTTVNISMPQEGAVSATPNNISNQLMHDNVTDYHAEDAASMQWRAPRGDSIFHKLR